MAARSCPLAARFDTLTRRAWVLRASATLSASTCRPGSFASRSMQFEVGLAAALKLAAARARIPVQISFVFTSISRRQACAPVCMEAISSQPAARAYRATVKACATEHSLTAVYDAVRRSVMNGVARTTLFVLCCVLAAQALAQPYPARPIRIVVPWTPGGVTDVLTRAVALQMSE